MGSVVSAVREVKEKTEEAVEDIGGFAVDVAAGGPIDTGVYGEVVRGTGDATGNWVEDTIQAAGDRSIGETVATMGLNTQVMAAKGLVGDLMGAGSNAVVGYAGDKGLNKVKPTDENVAEGVKSDTELQRQLRRKGGRASTILAGRKTLNPSAEGSLARKTLTGY